jgi:spermidine synthase
VVGLGAGSLTCHRSEEWTFFEIDPEVVRLARDAFDFVPTCAPQLAFVVGDARLTLAAMRQRYDVIVLDAFSTDAIPAHLLTREAMAGYLARRLQHEQEQRGEEHTDCKHGRCQPDGGGAWPAISAQSDREGS